MTGAAAPVARLGPGPLRIAVVGTGIAGLLAARLLATRHDVTVFEADQRIGGHTHTVDVEAAGRSWAIDTGFIVYNERNYPGFTRMLGALGVGSRPTTMSFSLRCDRTGLEYAGSDRPAQLFAQRRNLLRPRFWGMLRDVVRFHRDARRLLAGGAPGTLADVLAAGGYGAAFRDHYLVPMAAAVWSADPAGLLRMPAQFLLRFFHNHGMLQVGGRPQWRTLLGGSRSYLEPLARPFRDRVLTGVPVERLWRTADGVHVQARGLGVRAFDAAVVATHSDQALAVLADASAAERGVLGAVRYQPNDVVLHTDERLLPRRRRAWAAWNYRVPATPRGRVTVTYCMNLLQGLPLPLPRPRPRGAAATPVFCVTLNDGDAVDPARVLRRFVYHHPVFDRAAVVAQARVPVVNGCRRVWFCGAWCGYGFHEDGVRSALGVAADFGLSIEDLGAAPLTAAVGTA